MLTWLWGLLNNVGHLPNMGLENKPVCFSTITVHNITGLKRDMCTVQQSIIAYYLRITCVPDYDHLQFRKLSHN